MLDRRIPNTRPLWMDTAIIPRQPRQSTPIAVDVCIVGAGITGLTAAELLKNAGKTVAVIDLGRVGSGETSHTTGHLTEVLDISYRDLISKFGVEGAQLAVQSSLRAIERIEQNAAVYGIACDFHRLPGYRFVENRAQVGELEHEAEAAARIGVSAEVVFEAPLPFKTLRALRFADQAQFNPLRYLEGLARRIPGDGSYIFEDTRMIEVEEGEPCRVITEHGIIQADDIFMATNVPSVNRMLLHTKIAAYRTYAIAARVNDAFEWNNLFWDAGHPYHYIRTHEINGIPYLIIGGEDHKTGQDDHTAQHFERLEDWASERFNIETITHRWSGQIIEPADGLPYIGRNPLSNHVYVATGFSGTGLTFGTVAGMLVSDMILGRQNPWVELYEPARVKPLAAMKNFIAENVGYPSYLIGDRLAPAQANGTETLRENEGAIVRVGEKKWRPIEIPEAKSICCRPFVRTWAATCIGTAPRKAGIALATAPASIRSAN